MTKLFKDVKVGEMFMVKGSTLFGVKTATRIEPIEVTSAHGFTMTYTARVRYSGMLIAVGDSTKVYPIEG